MFLFLAKSASKMCLTIIILERKKEFLDSKIRKLFKTRRIWMIFPKGLVGFRQTYEIFPFFIFGKIRQENLFDDTLERKKSIFRL